MRRSISLDLLRTSVVSVAALAILLGSAHAEKKEKKDPRQLRDEYLARVQQEAPSGVIRTTGSLWSPGAAFNDFSSDYKARNLNDTVIIQVSVATSAAQSGNVNSQRTFAAKSSISGLPGDLKVKGVNPLIAADSSSALKGQGQSASNTTFQTSLAAQVIAVLPSGSMVVEAQRQIMMNNQRETVTVRGVVRPGDIGPNNTVPSAALSNLEIEMKGKGIISDSTRPPNPITRMVMWVLGF
ncbi:flagellar basal body L-ring protein FlgH [Acidobacteria bacterium AB60]|nr:flagellar basal body L-ring protein FlgH [Acidobacteria bacterium AB60]